MRLAAELSIIYFDLLCAIFKREREKVYRNPGHCLMSGYFSPPPHRNKTKTPSFLPMAVSLLSLLVVWG